jgi:hypothetical protein
MCHEGTPVARNKQKKVDPFSAGQRGALNRSKHAQRYPIDPQKKAYFDHHRNEIINCAKSVNNKLTLPQIHQICQGVLRSSTDVLELMTVDFWRKQSVS